MDSLIAWWIVAGALVLIGLAGLVLPGVPGPPLIFLGLVLAAWAEDFVHVGSWTIALLALLALLTYGVDLWATMFGAKKFGASRQAIVGAIAGLVLGILAGFPGLIFGPFIGAVAGELLAQKDLRQATRSGVGATIGLALGTALKLALACAMLGIFVLVRFV